MKYSSILNLIKTTDDVERVSDELEVLLSSLYKTKNGFKTALKKSVSIELAKVIKDLGGEAADLAGLLKNIQSYIKGLPVLKITLSFSPTQDFIEKMTTQKYIIDLSKDTSILGGAVISVNGRYKDYSLRKALERTFEEKRNVIIV